ncbi:demethylmenaquinone methyltransferase [Chryseomicrobium aureum]|uniref:demethylmenaquinone methyltransferase n=1 Tax=Chryseomicrobium aureum TaxID=1441723 RepID=UPI00195E3BA1|nr:demethylmenaquinone methyltransferase [Chryseomicrobium aureum]MBM7705515.1 demethylmenaquinone methyltransferase/2-methoxy-6-polyprenyl-1,4-benzoquinol methylase [Chryseomicrobium aureum]
MAKQKEQRVHEVFEKISSNYDSMNAVISFQQHKKWREDTMDAMAVKPGSAALDVCCGTADWTIALGQDVGESGRVVGLDFSQNMLSVGREKTAPFSQIELIHGNAMELPFADNEFDYVTIGFGLRNVPDYKKVLSEMYRVVKPGGMVVCLETSQPDSKLYNSFFRLYFRYIMPIFGKLFAKSYDEYSWLQESQKDFPNRQALTALFEEVGFKNVTSKPYSGGAAARHIGYKM